MTPRKKEFFIGIDAGGTSCRVLITDNELRKLAEKKFKGVHYSVAGGELYSDEITKYVNEVLDKKKLKIENCLGVCVGTAGAREENDREKLARLFRKKLQLKKVMVSTDALSAIYGAFSGGDGMILISGTGSVLYGMQKGKITRTGGWGRILGDGGSGYRIGHLGLRAIAKEYDERKAGRKESLLSKEIKKEFSITPDNIVEFVFDKKFDLQRAAPVVLECAKKGDKEAKKIADESAEELLHLLDIYFRITKNRSQVKLSLIGSIIENKNAVSDKFRKGVKERFPFVTITDKENSPEYGSVLLAKEKFKNN